MSFPNPRIIHSRASQTTSLSFHLSQSSPFALATGEQFSHATAKAKVPTKSLAIMMTQLEETFALQWNLFSSDQLAQVYGWLKPLRETADKQTHSSRGTRRKMVENPDYKPG